MSKLDLAKNALSVPVITAGVDLLTKSPIGEAMSKVVGAVDGVLNVGNSLTNPLFAPLGISLSGVAGGASAGLLTNQILNDLGVEKKWLKYTLNTAATLAGLATGPLSSPFLAAGALSYYTGKLGWKYGKGALKRITGATWGLTLGTLKGAVVGGYKSVKAGLKGEQKLNPVI